VRCVVAAPPFEAHCLLDGKQKPVIKSATEGNLRQKLAGFFSGDCVDLFFGHAGNPSVTLQPSFRGSFMVYSLPSALKYQWVSYGVQNSVFWNDSTETLILKGFLGLR